ncbi:MAG: 2-C-methyl-D-erythritol 4-phosphate cytidylyltransferase [Thermoleophilia bacterium]|nr:2-C-methyl-D-erythritol 4-phosphate cytidylyltransferase [Thermoleophilia bacterium]
MTAAGTWCVLVAAGEGARLGADRPKAFAPLAGRPLLAESLERLDASDWIDAIVVVAPAGWEEPAILLAEELVATKVSAVVVGGATRADSVAAGVAEVPRDALVVLVHDAARPLVDEEVLERLLGALSAGADGAVPTMPLADTLKRVAGGVVMETVPHEGLVAAQTPQAFLADRLRRALAADTSGATDCASLVERAGGRVAVVAGSARLAKVTTREDLALVEALLALEGA